MIGALVKIFLLQFFLLIPVYIFLKRREKKSAIFTEISYPLKAVVAIFLSFVVLGYISTAIGMIITSYQEIFRGETNQYLRFNPFVVALPHVVIIYLFYVFVKRHTKNTISDIIFKKDTISTSIRWILYLLFVFLPLFILGIRLGVLHNVSANVNLGIMQLPIASIVILAIIIPIAEELLFRGIIYNALKERTGVFAAMLLNAFIFMLAHMMLQGSTFLLLFIAGILYCFTYEKSKTLLVPILLHSIDNLVNALVRTESGMMFFTSLSSNSIKAISIFAIFCFVIIRFTKVPDKICVSISKIYNDRK